MKHDLDTFNTWIKRHRLFALSAPVVVFLMVYFLVNSIGSFGQKNEGSVDDSGYNNSLPGQANELEVQKPNDLFKKAQQDSLERLRRRGPLGNIVKTKNKNDSLERVLEELNAFSFDDGESLPKGNTTSSTPENQSNSQVHTDQKTNVQEKLEYRKLLLESREERQSRSQDYSAPQSGKSVNRAMSNISFDAAIYRDQFILPGDRVTLILKETVIYNGRKFPKNTFVYATANVQGSRVLLEVANIDNVPLPLLAKDREDGIVGLHNKRAGELLQEFKLDVQEAGLDEASKAIGILTDVPLAGNLVRSFGNFFQKKKYKQNDKILLINGDRLFLVPKK